MPVNIVDEKEPFFTKDGDRKCLICGSAIENIQYPHFHLSDEGSIIHSDKLWSDTFFGSLWSL